MCENSIYREDKNIQSFQVWKLVTRYGMPFPGWWTTSSSFFLAKKLVQTGLSEQSSMICSNLCKHFSFFHLLLFGLRRTRGRIRWPPEVSSKLNYSVILWRVNSLFSITLIKEQLLCAGCWMFCTLPRAALGCIHWSSSWYVCCHCAVTFDVCWGAPAERFWLRNAECNLRQK